MIMGPDKIGYMFRKPTQTFSFYMLFSILFSFFFLVMEYIVLSDLKPRGLH